MHDTAMRIGALALELYATSNSKILEIGSYDFNGALRSHAPERSEYVGLDIEAGPGVDVVIKPNEAFPVPDASFDLILASSVFEHDRWFWQTFLEMCRKLKPGGHIYVSAPSNGTVHRHPSDNWRFYPDAGHALVEWANANGHEIELVESFIAEREAVVWNDFVAVFRKVGGEARSDDRMLHQLVPATNIIVGRATEYINPRHDPEDQVILANAWGEIASLKNQFDSLVQQTGALNAAVGAERERADGLETSLWQHQITLAEHRAMVAAQQARIEDHLARFNEYNQLFALKESRSAEQNGRIADQAAALIESRESYQRQATMVADLNAELANAREEIDRLNTAHTDLQLEMVKLETGTPQLPTEDVEQVSLLLQQRDEALGLAEHARGVAERKLSERFAEIATLTKMLREQMGQVDMAKAQTQWLKQAAIAAMGFPKWWSLLPTRLRLKKEHRRLTDRGLFNEQLYSQLYPDVIAHGMDPFRHFVMHGLEEGRKNPL